MGILITILALGFVIFIHEMGHLLAAKRAGVGVLEFSIGMGPKIFGRTFGGTLYSLRVFPIGGFVKLAGMDDEPDVPVPDEINYHKKSVGARLLTISAGSLMNIFLGFVIFLFLFLVSGVPQQSTRIADVSEGMPAMKAGLMAGDEIVAFQGKGVDISRRPDDVVHMIEVIRSSVGKPLVFTVLREDQKRDVSIVPENLSKAGEHGAIGVVFGEKIYRYSLGEGLVLSVKATWDRIVGVFEGLGMLFSGKAGVKDLSGPIGIVQFASYGFQKGLIYFLSIISMISISLGVFNLLPFPVLDGGYIVFLLLEAIIGRPINKEWQTRIIVGGMVILGALMLFVVVNDVLNWQHRVDIFKKLFP